MKKQVCGVLAGCLLSMSGWAQESYIGADFSFLSSDISARILGRTYSWDADPTLVRVKGGVALNKNFAIEGFLGMGLQDDEIGDSSTDFGVDNMYGVNAVVMVPLDRVFGLFAKLGFASVEYDSDEVEYSIDDSGILFAAGMAVNFDRNAAMTLEYTILPDVEGDRNVLEVESEMISIGAHFTF